MKPVSLFLLLLAAGFVGFSLVEERHSDGERVSLALIPEEVRELCARTGCSIEDFLERAKTIGVSAALVNAQPLDAWLDRGDVLYFSKADAEKWNLAGLAGPASPFKANSLWSRDPTTFSHLVETAKLRGIGMSTQAVNGVMILTLDDEFDVQAFPSSFDLQLIRFIRDQGLTPVLHSGQFEDAAPLFREAKGARLPLIVYADAPLPAGSDAGPVWLASPERRWIKTRPAGMPRGVLVMSEIKLSDGVSAAWRAVWGKGSRLLLIHLSADRGVEENLDMLRTLARSLRDGGALSGRTPATARFSTTAWEPWTRYLAATLLVILAPLLAMRQGLHLLRRTANFMKVLLHGSRLHKTEGLNSIWVQATPVPEVASAFSGVVASALGLGLLSHALMNFPEWRTGLFGMPWLVWTTICPMLISGVSLYAADIKIWKKNLRRSLTYLGVLKALGTALALALFLFPRNLLGAAGLLPFLDRSAAFTGWWVPFRWRETFLGYPCLLMGLNLHYRYLREMPGSMPEHRLELASRPWLLAGLLGPIGMIHVFGQGRAPSRVLVPATLLSVGTGVLIFLGAIAVRGVLRRTVLKP